MGQGPGGVVSGVGCGVGFEGVWGIGYMKAGCQQVLGCVCAHACVAGSEQGKGRTAPLRVAPPRPTRSSGACRAALSQGTGAPARDSA